MSESPGIHIRQYELTGVKYMRGSSRSLEEMRKAMPRRRLPFVVGLASRDPELVSYSTPADEAHLHDSDTWDARISDFDSQLRMSTPDWLKMKEKERADKRWQ